MVLQQRTGLRPGELVEMRRGDVSFPGERDAGARSVVVIALGMKSGTKAKRSQFVVLNDPELMGLLRFVCHHAAEVTVLFPTPTKPTVDC